MRWSWKLGEVSGIAIYVHATFFLLIAWVVARHWIERAELGPALAGVGFVLALFACVVLHELGHALTARRFGIRTRDITLLPIGGLARMERMPDDPRQELWVALAGPAVNVAIAAVLFAWLRITGTWQPIEQLTVGSGSFAQRLMIVNVSLVVFNLLPAFPMDGGRVVRSLLAMRMDYARATQAAAVLGQGMALLFGLVGLFTNPFLVFIALFVWIGAAQEAGAAQMKTALGGIPVSRVMISEYHTLTPQDPVRRAVELLLAGSQQDFPVVSGGEVVGVLTRAELFAALARRGQETQVGEVMRRDIQIVDSHDMLEAVLGRLQDAGVRTLPVTRNGTLVGLLTMENIGEFLTIQAALRPAGAPA
ncbi:MAG: site-2 protease family protein [Armatimonadota bacterium]